MFASFPLILLIPLFVTGAAAVWLAGIQLSNTTDIIDVRFGRVKHSVALCSWQLPPISPRSRLSSVLP